MLSVVIIELLLISLKLILNWFNYFSIVSYLDDVDLNNFEFCDTLYEKK